MKKKLLYFFSILLIFLVILFFYIQKNIGNKFDNNLSFLRALIPPEYRLKIKETIFVYKNQYCLTF